MFQCQVNFIYLSYYCFNREENRREKTIVRESFKNLLTYEILKIVSLNFLYFITARANQMWYNIFRTYLSQLHIFIQPPLWHWLQEHWGLLSLFLPQDSELQAEWIYDFYIDTINIDWYKSYLWALTPDESLLKVRVPRILTLLSPAISAKFHCLEIFDIISKIFSSPGCNNITIK